MKLYVWRGKGVFEQCGTGHAIVFANSVEEAREAVMKYCREYYWWFFDKNGTFIDAYEEEDFEDYTSFLKNEPEIFNTPVAFCIQGSE